MRVRNLQALVTISVLTFFLFLPNQVHGNAQIGLALSGPLLNQRYTVTHGQTIEGYLRLENSGALDCFYEFASVIQSGPVDSVNVTLPSDSMLHPPASVIQTNWTFGICENASGLVVVRITVTASGTDTNGSQVSASISGNVYFEVDPDACTVDVRVIDQYGWPVQNAEIELVRDRVSYVRQRTNENGTTRFSLTKAVYTLRLFRYGVLHRTATLNITEPRLFTFDIFRELVRIEGPPTLPLFEIGLGFFLGYIVAYVELHRRIKSARESQKSDTAEWIEWSKEPVS